MIRRKQGYDIIILSYNMFDAYFIRNMILLFYYLCLRDKLDSDIIKYTLYINYKITIVKNYLYFKKKNIFKFNK